MSMRTYSGVILLTLSGCQSAPDTNIPANAATEASARGNAAGRTGVECALGAADFARVCTLERVRAAEGVILTVRQPDGGFHRFRMTDDGRGVIAADGAEPAVVRVIGPAAIEVAMGDARYRLPASVGPLLSQ